MSNPEQRSEPDVSNQAEMQKPLIAADEDVQIVTTRNGTAERITSTIHRNSIEAIGLIVQKILGNAYGFTQNIYNRHLCKEEIEWKNAKKFVFRQIKLLAEIHSASEHGDFWKWARPQLQQSFMLFMEGKETIPQAHLEMNLRLKIMNAIQINRNKSAHAASVREQEILEWLVEMDVSFADIEDAIFLILEPSIEDAVTNTQEFIKIFPEYTFQQALDRALGSMPWAVLHFKEGNSLDINEFIIQGIIRSLNKLSEPS